MLKFASIPVVTDVARVCQSTAQVVRGQWALWQAGRRLAREQERCWAATLQEARWMANQARAMTAMADAKQ